MPKIYLTLLLISLRFVVGAQEFQTPDAFLGYGMGAKHTPHHQIVAYFDYCKSVFPSKTKWISYGKSEEGRPLGVMVVSSAVNINQLDEIKKNNLIKTGLEKGLAKGETPALVWLSHSIHGNESSGSESAMYTLYELLNSKNAKTQAWLANTVVIIDPSLNPDGREHFINHLVQFGSFKPNTNTDDVEHKEPWPSGRYNHYFFDLNRDWAWQTQVETQQRLEVYSQFMPHIHADLHEMSLNSPYFFAPPARPLHTKVSDWQRIMFEKMGKNHAQYFDEKGWLYYTKDVYDLFYPSYGDSWPTFHGSIGMTYEQANTKGRAALMENGIVLTFADAVLHHHTTALSTIEVASLNAGKIVSEFEKYFNQANKASTHQFKSFVLKDGYNKSKLMAMLDKNNIAYGQVKETTKQNGYSFANKKNESFVLNKEDLVINTAQPMGMLVDILFNPNYLPEDSLTYDITAWSLGYAFNLETFGLPNPIVVAEAVVPNKKVNMATEAIPYAIVVKWESTKSAAFAMAALEAGFKLRFAKQPFKIDNVSFGSGSILILKYENAFAAAKIKQLIVLGDRYSVPLHHTFSGLVQTGKDLGSDNFELLNKPKVGFFTGGNIVPPAAGEVWYMLEKELDMPFSVLNITDFQQTDLSKYNTLVLPNGEYKDYFEGKNFDHLLSWVKNGGKLVLMQDAMNFVKDKLPFALKSFLTDEEKIANSKHELKEKLLKLNRCYGEREREKISADISGAILKVQMDTTHYLGYGYRKTYYTLKQSSSYIPKLIEGWNVGTTPARPIMSGFVGKDAKLKVENSLVFGEQALGKGSVVYMTDDPIFRMFWEGGKLIFCNALLFKYPFTP